MLEVGMVINSEDSEEADGDNGNAWIRGVP